MYTCWAWDVVYDRVWFSSKGTGVQQKPCNGMLLEPPVSDPCTHSLEVTWSLYLCHYIQSWDILKTEDTSIWACVCTLNHSIWNYYLMRLSRFILVLTQECFQWSLQSPRIVQHTLIWERSSPRYLIARENMQFLHAVTGNQVICYPLYTTISDDLWPKQSYKSVWTLEHTNGTRGPCTYMTVPCPFPVVHTSHWYGWLWPAFVLP